MFRLRLGLAIIFTHRRVLVGENFVEVQWYVSLRLRFLVELGLQQTPCIENFPQTYPT